MANMTEQLSTLRFDNAIMARVSGFFAHLAEKRARAAIYRQTVRELGRLSSRDLADLGINDSMITSIAYEAAQKAVAK